MVNDVLSALSSDSWLDSYSFESWCLLKSRENWEHIIKTNMRWSTVFLSTKQPTPNTQHTQELYFGPVSAHELFTAGVSILDTASALKKLNRIN